jgi:histidinol-phosphate aminotransferase
MSRFWNPILRDLKPYVPGEQPKADRLVKLNTNENPYGPSPRAVAAIQAAANDGLRLYPDPEATALKEAIARYHGLSMDQVFVGNGSDEILAHTFLGLLKHEKPLLFPDITYSFYPVYCGLYQVHHELVPLRDDFTIDPDDYQRENGGIIFANPNAPTGLGLPLAAIERILAANPHSVVAVDEAYIDFGGASAVGLIANNPNLLVIHTLSKSRSLAGLRVGFAMGQRELIEGLERVKNSFNSYPLDRLAIAGAVAAINDRAYFEETRLKVIRTREELTGGLQALGFEVLPSQANFVFARHPAHDAAALSMVLRQRGIIVRLFRLPRIDQFLRITIGTDEACAELVTALAEILNG